MITIRSSRVFAGCPADDRYVFDTTHCRHADGWAQIDGWQDASYYGTWTNPFLLQILSYCEGDITLQMAETDEEYARALRELAEWAANDERFGIDPGWPDGDMTQRIKDRFLGMGLSGMLH